MKDDKEFLMQQRTNIKYVVDCFFDIIKQNTICKYGLGFDCDKSYIELKFRKLKSDFNKNLEDYIKKQTKKNKRK